MHQQPEANALAFMNYESSNGTFPTTTILVPCPTGAPGGGSISVTCGGFQSSWSAFARAASYLKQYSLYNSINFDFTYSDATDTTVTYTPLAFLYCPSDPGNHIDDSSLGGTGYATTSYGTCDGDWYVWSVNWGATNTIGPMNRSLFGPNYAKQIAQITDGTSNTLSCSEGYIGHAQMRSCMSSPAVSSDPSVVTSSPTNVRLPRPNSANALALLINGCGTAAGKVNAGGSNRRSRLANGDAYYPEFTPAILLNSDVSLPGRAVSYSYESHNTPMGCYLVTESGLGATCGAVFGHASSRYVSLVAAGKHCARGVPRPDRSRHEG